MAYKEKVQNAIRKDELRTLWKKVCESYERGNVEQIKLSLNKQISKLKGDYREQIEKLEEML